MADEERKTTDQPPPFPELPDVLGEETEPSAPPLSDDSGFDADATLQKIKQQQPAMESVAQKEQSHRRVVERKQRLGILPQPAIPNDATPKERVAARGKQRAQERQQRLGRTESEASPHPVAGPLVDYEGPYEKPPQQQPAQRQPQQQPPNHGDNQGMNILLAELQKQTEFLKTIATKIETLGTYGA